MTPEIDLCFAQVKQEHGDDSIIRIEDMLSPSKVHRDALQEQAKFLVPRLSTTPWLDPQEFPDLSPLVNRLESEASDIKQEVNAAIAARSALITDYDHYLGTQSDWNALYLYRNGEVDIQTKDLVPVTWDIFQRELREWHCPLLEVHFSILRAGASIKPHCDLWNFTLNLHLAVDIPDHCSLTVANDTREWKEGSCLLFDYSYLHHAQNRSNSDRICLLMDIWHPGLSLAERKALTTLISELRKFI